MLQEKWTTILILVLVSLMTTVLVSEVVAQAPQAGPNQGFAAIDRAAKANKYLFIFFFRQDDEQTRLMGQIFNAATNAVANRADPLAVRITDTSAAEIERGERWSW